MTRMRTNSNNESNSSEENDDNVRNDDRDVIRSQYRNRNQLRDHDFGDMEGETVSLSRDFRFDLDYDNDPEVT